MTEPFPSRQAEKQSVLLAAIGSISVSEDSDSGTVTFSAGCLTGAALLRADITVPLSAASSPTTATSGGGSHTLHRCADPVDAPALCLTAGVGRSLMIGDSVGRVTVFDAEMNRHAHYRWYVTGVGEVEGYGRWGTMRMS